MRRIVRNLSNFQKSTALVAPESTSRAISVKSKCTTFTAQKPNFVYCNISRKYSGTARSIAKECWNCKKVTSRKNHMICSECGYLQDLTTDMNYFDLLELPKSFELETQELTKRFRQLQTLVHPDKFSQKTKREQTNSADWSSLINKAYKTLSVPVERGQYILLLNGEQIPQDNSALDKEFLMEMMERNEEIEAAATNEELQRLNEQIVQELNEKIVKLSAEFEANALDAAKAILVQMKYLLSMQKTIKNKMQALMGS